MVIKIAYVEAEKVYIFPLPDQQSADRFLAAVEHIKLRATRHVDRFPQMSTPSLQTPESLQSLHAWLALVDAARSEWAHLPASIEISYGNFRRLLPGSD